MSTTYRFKVSIQEKGKQRQAHVDKNTFVLGRGKDTDITIHDDLISREHISISYLNGKIWLEDLGSSNGTWLNGKKIASHQKVAYHPGQSLCLGGKGGPLLQLECAVIEDVGVIEEEVHFELPKVANGNYAPATTPKKSTPSPVREKLTVISSYDIPPEAKISQIKNEAEQSLFDHIRALVGNEAEVIKQACLDEASKIKKNAEQEAVKKIKDAEAYVSKKTSELRNYESEAEKKLEASQKLRFKAQLDTEELRKEEVLLRSSLEELQKNIKEEEERIGQETLKLEEQRSDFLISQNSLNARIEEWEIKERQYKDQMRFDLDECQERLEQLNADIKNSEDFKSLLEPELQNLQFEKNEILVQISDIRNSFSEEEQKLKELVHEHSVAQHHLDSVKQQIESAALQLEKQNAEMESKKAESLVLYQKAKDDLEASKNEAKELLAIAHSQIEELTQEKENLESEISAERSHRLLEMDEEIQKLSKENETNITKLVEKKSALIKEIEKIAVTGHEEFHKIINEAKAKSLDIREQADIEVQKIKSEAKAVLEKAERERISLLEATKLEILAEKEKTAIELEKYELQKIEAIEGIKEAQLQKEEILSSAQDQVKEIIAQAENEAGKHKHQLIEAAKVEGREVLNRIEAEAKEQKIKLQSQMGELKHIEMMKLKELRTQAEEEWIDRRTERARGVATNLYALMASEMYKSRNKVLDDAFIESFSREFKEVVLDTMLDRVGADDNKLQSILKTSSDAKEKEKAFWKKVKISSMSGAFIMALLIIFPQILTAPRDAIVSAFVDKKVNSGSDEFFNKVKEARVKAVYNPTTTPEFKSSYVENMLYTTDYLSNIQSNAFQDKWILELNDYFIRSLDVKDTTIIKFVSLETTLLKDLEKIKSEIDPQQIAAGLELMNKREDEFKKKLSDIFADPTKVSRYYDFSAKFWKDFFNPRRPAQ